LCSVSSLPLKSQHLIGLVKQIIRFPYHLIVMPKMSYVLVSTEDFHRGPTRLSSIDPYLHEKLPLTLIKDTVFFQVFLTFKSDVILKYCLFNYRFNIDLTIGRISIRSSRKILEVQSRRRARKSSKQVAGNRI
jgi:hypothetical protein